MSMGQNFRRFSKESGFKVLALARLSQGEYSIMLYLLNCAASGLDELITTEVELASLMGYDENSLQKALGELAGKNLIKLHYHENNHHRDLVSMRLAIQYDLSKWILSYDVEATSSDALVFPFRRGGKANFQVLDGQKIVKKKNESDGQTWQRIANSFTQGRSLDEDEIASVEENAKILVDTHPVDQVLLMIRHFGMRIPTLSLLASSWQHYQEIFESETMKVDMLGARQKHQELDQKIRDQAKLLLDDSGQEWSDEEKTVLQILLKHQHPRRQLFWAYQLRSRYPKLLNFFNDNVNLMLSVTSGGSIVKK
jgi:DNA-binding MarR family transcriptional regulator